MCFWPGRYVGINAPPPAALASSIFGPFSSPSSPFKELVKIDCPADSLIGTLVLDFNPRDYFQGNPLVIKYVKVPLRTSPSNSRFWTLLITSERYG
ncbi:unnamed protein product [Linum trigynum]|uniref:Uncharacterized protein n=1 Tax=Linum trigynum TaxID=586398 RepID=A0AAV2EJI5_9ROSI